MEPLTPERLVAYYDATSLGVDSVLADIDLVNWSLLNHAHGPATDVPALLRATLSDTVDHREFAFQLLHETIWHQGTVYEASSYVVPFLFNMLRASATPDPTSVAFLLASLADGYSQWAQETRLAVGKEIHLLYPYLAHDDPTVRWGIVKALTHYPERASEILPLLEQALRVEDDRYNREEMQTTLHTIRSAASDPVP